MQSGHWAFAIIGAILGGYAACAYQQRTLAWMKTLPKYQGVPEYDLPLDGASIGGAILWMVVVAAVMVAGMFLVESAQKLTGSLAYSSVVS